MLEIFCDRKTGKCGVFHFKRSSYALSEEESFLLAKNLNFFLIEKIFFKILFKNFSHLTAEG